MRTRMFRIIVKTHMSVQLIFSLKKPFIRAYVALKFSLITVSCLVAFQRTLASKCFIANRTRVWFLSGVSSHVSVKINFTIKTLQANFTLMRRFVVIRHVVSELMFGFKVPVILAYLALEFSLITVSCQVVF